MHVLSNKTNLKIDAFLHIHKNNNKTGDTSGAGTAVPLEHLSLHLVCSRILVARVNLSFLCNVWRSYFVLLSFSFGHFIACPLIYGF